MKEYLISLQLECAVRAFLKTGDYLGIAMKAKSAGPSPLSLMTDELGDLEKELAPLAPKLARVEALRKSIKASFDTADPSASCQADGQRFIVLLGARGNERTIQYPKLVKSIGAKAFAQFATCTLKALEANVKPEVLAEVVAIEATGSRTLKVFERGSAAA